MAFVCLLFGALAGTFLVRPLLYGQKDSARAEKETAVYPKELTSYRDVVKKVLPAVVSIESEKKPRVKPKAKKEMKNLPRPKFEDFPFPDEQLRKFFKEFEQHRFGMDDDDDSPVPSHGFGSGFLVDPKGVILTNYHVVAGADQVKVQLRDGSKYVSKDIHGDRKTDLAIVRIDPKGKSLPYLELGDSDGMQIGDRVLAVGAPFGLTGSVTSGIVSAKGRNGLNMNMYEDFLQTDAAINPGNSGGPLVNLEGKVIGINAAIKTRNGGFQGVGLAVASNLAKAVMKSLEKDGVVHRGYLGIQIKDLTKEVAKRLGLQHKYGVIVGNVFKGSPAAKAGIKSGDIITSLNGKPVKEGRMLQTVVASLPLKKAVPVTVVRDGQTRKLEVTIEEQPETFGTRQIEPSRTPRREKETVKLDKVGIEVADLTADLAEELGYSSNAKGAVVVRVEPGSAAAEAGLRKGMLIVKVDKKGVDSASGLRKQLKNASLEKGALFQVKSPQGGVDYIVVKVEPATTEKK
jgi:serine protease Do